MKGDRRPGGYTIVEVMIVLAISGVMFLIAVGFISGKQARTEFTAGTNQFASQLQTIISQVVNGQYSDVPFGCSASSAGITFQSMPNPSNPSCILIGKYLYFPENNATTYSVFTLASEKQDASVSPTPPPVSPIDDPADHVNLTLTQVIPQSLSIQNVKIISPTPVGNTYGIGFVQSLNNTLLTGSATGSQTVGMVYSPRVKAGGAGQSEPTVVGDLTRLHYGLTPVNSAKICVTDGTRYADIELGDSSGADQLSVNVQVVPTLAACET